MVEKNTSDPIKLSCTYLLDEYGIPLMKQLEFHPTIIDFTDTFIKTIKKLEDKILDITSENTKYNPKNYFLTRDELLILLSIDIDYSINEYQDNYVAIKVIIDHVLNKNKDSVLDIRRVFENIVSQTNQYLGKNFDTLTNDIDGKYSKNSFPEWLSKLNYEYPPQNMPKVFLSHAYTDQPVTMSLFKYLYKNNIYLYVDWMHNTKMQTLKLKNSLIRELNSSHQILFLRTLNSELKLRGGNNQIRQWCAWEIGCFDCINQYNNNNNNKFYFNVYIDSTTPRSDLIDGYKPMTRIIPSVGIT